MGIAVVSVILIFFIPMDGKTVYQVAKETVESWVQITQVTIMKLEGFRSAPYWDNKQWSWGYGTRVPDSTNDPNVIPRKTITKLEAVTQAMGHINNDKAYLSKLIKIPLTNNAWAALLSFSYNEGSGAAKLLVPEINSKNWAGLYAHMRLYNKEHKNGVLVVSKNLTDRREYEIKLFNNNA